MKRIYFACICCLIAIFISTIISCSKNNNEQGTANIEDEGNISLSDDFLNLFNDDRLRYFETTLFHDAPLYIVGGDETTILESVPAGTFVRILAQSNLGDNRYYLVRIDGDSNMWSGWIKDESVAPDSNEAIRSMTFTKEQIVFLPANVSTRNDILVATASWNEEFIMVKRSGEIIYRMPVIETFPLGNHGDVIGWTSDATKVWIAIHMDASTVNFAIIDIVTKELTIFDAPFDLGSDWSINYDTGDMWYDDYPSQFDGDIARATKASGKEFHLFAFNFFTKEQKIVDTNIGEGFNISFNKIGGFTYERTNNY